VSINEEAIATTAGSLTIPAGVSLRAARLEETLAKLQRPVWRRFAKKLGFIEEKKWLCEAIWTGREGTKVKGWCIHEIATWPR
jgi:hypothetical protein